ncbi:hypothetical protein [Paraburkholderia bonniea]|uniref:hypothetical protein n=1 Tax=Paraburkholderia bonniea TaxID=2152891 RepID=UPI001291B67A|nr:hypothetical protein [Paraburkholderia bonniea]
MLSSRLNNSPINTHKTNHPHATPSSSNQEISAGQHIQDINPVTLEGRNIASAAPIDKITDSAILDFIKILNIFSPKDLSRQNLLGVSIPQRYKIISNELDKIKTSPQFSLYMKKVATAHSPNTTLAETTSYYNSLLFSLIRLEQKRVEFGEFIKNHPNPLINTIVDPEISGYKLVMEPGHSYVKAFGHLGFEEERGYLPAMLDAAMEMLNSIDKIFDENIFEKFHKLACRNVTQANDPVLFMKSGFRDKKQGSIQVSLHPGPFVNDTTFDDGRINFYNFTQDGIKEYKKKFVPKWHCLASDGVKDYIVLLPRSASELRAKAKELIEQYHFEIKCIQSNSYKPGQRNTAIMKAIATLCQDLDQHHLFSDGNIRVIVFLVMNLLLLQNKMSPLIFENPHIIDGYAIDEIVKLMRSGQDRYNQLRATEKSLPKNKINLAKPLNHPAA